MKWFLPCISIFLIESALSAPFTWQVPAPEVATPIQDPAGQPLEISKNQVEGELDSEATRPLSATPNMAGSDDVAQADIEVADTGSVSKEGGSPVAPRGFSRTGDRLRFHARDLGVAEALAQLRNLLHRNIVVDPNVTMRFTGDLYDVTPEEAIEAICSSSGLEARFEGEFIYVEPAPLRSVIYTLYYSTAPEVLPLLEHLLSADGKVSVAGQSLTEAGANAGFAGGKSSTRILVLDYPFNQDRVAATIADLEGAGHDAQNDSDLVNRVFHLEEMVVEEVARMFAPLLSSQGVITAAGKGSAQESTKSKSNAPASGGVILVRDYPANVKAIAEAIAQVHAGGEQIQFAAQPDRRDENRGQVAQEPTPQPRPAARDLSVPQITSKVFHLNYVRAQDALPLLEPLLSGDGRIAASASAEQGISPSQIDAGGNSVSQLDMIVVSDYATNIEDISQVLEEIDVRPRQVLIEATIIAATLLEGMEYGLSLTGMDGVTINDPLNAEAAGIGAVPDLSDGSITPGGITPDDIARGIGLGTSNLGSWLSSAGLNLAFFQGDVSALVRAVAAKTKVSVLATPKVITLNKQRGEVLLGSRDGFKQETTSQTSTTQQIEYLETGTRLIYRPFISGDGYVRLEIHPEDSDGGLNADGLPFSDTVEITTNVLVKDGETVIIGGLFREREADETRKIPLLGDLPLLGHLFRGKKKVLLREEIIILLTPHIISGEPTAEDRQSIHTNEANRDVRQVAAAYLSRARELAGAGSAASASFLLDAVDSIGLHEDASARLREAVGRDVSKLGEGGVIDEILSRKILASLLPDSAPMPAEVGSGMHDASGEFRSAREDVKRERRALEELRGEVRRERQALEQALTEAAERERQALEQAQIEAAEFARQSLEDARDAAAEFKRQVLEDVRAESAERENHALEGARQKAAELERLALEEAHEEARELERRALEKVQQESVELEREARKRADVEAAEFEREAFEMVQAKAGELGRQIVEDVFSSGVLTQPPVLEEVHGESVESQVPVLDALSVEAAEIDSPALDESRTEVEGSGQQRPAEPMTEEDPQAPAVQRTQDAGHANADDAQEQEHAQEAEPRGEPIEPKTTHWVRTRITPGIADPLPVGVLLGEGGKFVTETETQAESESKTESEDNR